MALWEDLTPDEVAVWQIRRNCLGSSTFFHFSHSSLQCSRIQSALPHKTIYHHLPIMQHLRIPRAQLHVHARPPHHLILIFAKHLRPLVLDQHPHPDLPSPQHHRISNRMIQPLPPLQGHLMRRISPQRLSSRRGCPTKAPSLQGPKIGFPVPGIRTINAHPHELLGQPDRKESRQLLLMSRVLRRSPIVDVRRGLGEGNVVKQLPIAGLVRVWCTGPPPRSSLPTEEATWKAMLSSGSRT